MTEKAMSWQKMAIIGTGLLGGSIGLAMKKLGYKGEILGVGRTQNTLDLAKELGCVDTTSTDLRDACCAEMVIIATPVGTINPILDQLAEHLREIQPNEHPIITDVGSTKASIVAHGCQVLPDSTRFVGSHPMAGREEHGPSAAREDLFRNRPVVICAHPDTDSQIQATVTQFWQALGMRIIEQTPEDHDRTVAYVSHLPHILAGLLVDVVHGQNALDGASTGFADTTRVASGDGQIWVDILLDNRDAIIDALDQFTTAQDNLRQIIDAGDRKAIAQWLSEVKQTRDRWLERFTTSD